MRESSWRAFDVDQLVLGAMGTSTGTGLGQPVVGVPRLGGLPLPPALGVLRLSPADAQVVLDVLGMRLRERRRVQLEPGPVLRGQPLTGTMWGCPACVHARINERQRSGWVTASSCTTNPPNDCPYRCARSIRSSSSTARQSSTNVIIDARVIPRLRVAVAAMVVGDDEALGRQV